MSMSGSVRFWLFSREFSLRCDPGQEERLHFLVSRLKERLEALSVTMPPAQRSLPAQMELLVMAAVTFADEFSGCERSAKSFAGCLSCRTFTDAFFGYLGGGLTGSP